MTEPRASFPVVVLSEAVTLVSPLAYFASPRGPESLLRTLGWDPPQVAATVASLDSLPADVASLFQALDQVASAADDDEMLEKLGAVAQQLASLIGKATQLVDQIETELGAVENFVEQADLGNEDDGFVVRLIDWLVLRYLANEHQRIHAVLLLLGLIEYVEITQPGPKRLAGTVAKVHWKRLPKLVTNPVEVADAAYQWSTAVDHEKLIARVGGVAGSFGLVSGHVEQNTAAHTALGRPATETTELRVPLVQTVEAGARAEAGLLLSEAPPHDTAKKGIAISPYGEGSVSFEIELRPGLKATVALAAGAQGGLVLAVRPTGIEPYIDLLGAGGNAAFGVKVARVPTGTDPVTILAGSPGNTRFEAARVYGGVTGAVEQQGAQIRPELRLEGGLEKGAIVVMPGQGDGFLKKVLPEKGIKAEIDLGVIWSTKSGFHFTGGAGLEVELASNLTIADVIKLQSVLVGIRGGVEGLSAVVAVSGSVKLGPLAASIAQVGARGTLALEADHAGTLGPFTPRLDFKPPSGAGLSIKAGPVTGGGYIFFDVDKEEYAGILQLSFQSIGLTVIGVLTTRLPDPSGAPGATKKGFSLVLIITFELPPIQLGYGFALNGVGGLLGIHRTMMVDALRNGVRDGSVGSILFPQDPVARAPQIISQIRSIFPPSEGRFIFGPMVKIGWGPNAIIELAAAVILELMSPLRLVILGRIQVALPDKKDPVLNLRLDIVGVLDFEKSEASVDASLIDSRLVVFTLTGDMAVRIGWGATKIFALAAGGFHPAFQPPPGFPSLRRLAISFGDSPNPRLRMETYMALTANSIQFGALLDIYVKVDIFVGSISVAANIAFDALIQFQPFELLAELGASVDIELNDEPLLHAAFHATLSGPTPWHAIGYAEFDFLGKHRVDVELTSGPAAKPPPAEISPGNVLAAVSEAFSRPDAWVALPPSEADRVVALRDQQPTAGVVVVHPLGALSARQRVLPLGHTIDRFGTSIVAPTEFTLKGFQVAGAGVTTPQAGDLHDDFAPGQFNALSDDEALARPAFESMRSGGQVKATLFRLPADRPSGVPGDSGYQEAIVDVEPTTGLRSAGAAPAGKPATLPGATLAALVHGGPAAHAETRSNGSREFRGPDLGVDVESERYVVAGSDTLSRDSGAPTESAAEAHDRLSRRSPTAAPAQVVPAREAA